VTLSQATRDLLDAMEAALRKLPPTAGINAALDALYRASQGEDVAIVAAELQAQVAAGPKRGSGPAPTTHTGICPRCRQRFPLRANGRMWPHGPRSQSCEGWRDRPVPGTVQPREVGR